MSRLRPGQYLENREVVEGFIVLAAQLEKPLQLLTFYAYQTGSPTTSTITAENFRIWDGPPGAGGTVIFGDTSTNLMTGTVWSNIYRTTETSFGDTNRPIMANTLALAVPIQPFSL